MMEMSALVAKSSSERLHELFDVDYEQGLLFWKSPRSRRLKVGDIAGCRRKDGRTVVYFDDQKQYRYRIIWCMFYGIWPENQIDHIDQDPSNDSISNLRDVTNEENSWNKGLHSKNKTGVPGVHVSRLGQYVAQIHIKGRTRHIGSFTSLEAARIAREDYLNKYLRRTNENW